jgi:DNA polymerase III subunit delta
MIRSFSGDQFLAGRAYRAAVAAEIERGRDVRRLGEGVDARAVADALAQGGLFGPAVVAVDLDEAFLGGGAGATAPRNAVIDAIAAAGADASVIVLDSAATPARQKRYRALGELAHAPTPRYGHLVRWIRDELSGQGLETTGDVAGTLLDLFGEDLAAIASEVTKLRALGERLDPDRVRSIANRPAARSAFDLVDAIVAGDAGSGLRIARGLLGAGEAPVRVMAALGWQLDLIAGCVALEASGGLGVEGTAKALRSSPYPTRKALSVAARLDEAALDALVETFVASDERMKGGGDPEWLLESCVLSLANALRGAPRRAQRGARAP